MNPAPPHNIYGIGADSQGNEYGADILGSAIAKVDAQTGKATLFQLPNPKSGPRRMHTDSQDRIWFGEFYGNRLGMLDPRTGEIKEWAHPIPWYGPYDAVLDKAGNVWTGSMSTDFITRLNPNTGKFNHYLLPDNRRQCAQGGRRQLRTATGFLGGRKSSSENCQG